MLWGGHSDAVRYGKTTGGVQIPVFQLIQIHHNLYTASGGCKDILMRCIQSFESLF